MSHDANNVHAQRLDIIRRAIDHLNTTDQATLLTQLATTRVYDHFKTNPAALADSFRSALTNPDDRGAWRVAASLLATAGLPSQ
ncbi:hypothetical protein [Microtetraspora malaysiensis]|uniref:Uncharacterized protein n=1 Tax=Microtetraspora malaysiensis TaxID=161358 RepID=A0ABW6SKL4_9ACTN